MPGKLNPSAWAVTCTCTTGLRAWPAVPVLGALTKRDGWRQTNFQVFQMQETAGGGRQLREGPFRRPALLDSAIFATWGPA